MTVEKSSVFYFLIISYTEEVESVF